MIHTSFQNKNSFLQELFTNLLLNSGFASTMQFNRKWFVNDTTVLVPLKFVLTTCLCKYIIQPAKDLGVKIAIY